jgi:hypothetical protein
MVGCRTSHQVPCLKCAALGREDHRFLCATQSVTQPNAAHSSATPDACRSAHLIASPHPPPPLLCRRPAAPMRACCRAAAAPAAAAAAMAALGRCTAFTATALVGPLCCRRALALQLAHAACTTLHRPAASTPLRLGRGWPGCASKLTQAPDRYAPHAQRRTRGHVRRHLLPFLLLTLVLLASLRRGCQF